MSGRECLHCRGYGQIDMYIELQDCEHCHGTGRVGWLKHALQRLGLL